MPRSSGTYTPPAGQPVQPNTVISTTVFNALVADLGNELTNSIPRDGTAPPTANMPMGNYKITGLGPGTQPTDAPQLQQVQSGAVAWLSSVAGVDTITASVTTPAAAAYVAGQVFRFIPAGANLTTAVTLNINGLGAKSVLQNNSVAMQIGLFSTSQVVEVVYDGTQFQVISNIDDLNNTSVTLASAATVNIGAQSSTNVNISGAATVTAFDTVVEGLIKFITFTGAVPITYNATSMQLIGSASRTYAVGDFSVFKSLGSGNWKELVYQAISPAGQTSPPVRQTVLSGPVDTNGLPSFGGSTGATTVTASGTLTATAANGTANRTGSITNPAWTGISTNGTMYLYLDIDASGVCTTGSTTLAPTYRWGGADVTTNNQFTFNIQEMIGKVGTGAVATQTYRVFVGQVTVAGAVVTAITWYALMGRYQSEQYGLALSTAYSNNHNLGVIPQTHRTILVNTTTELGYAVGDEVDGFGIHSSSANNNGFTPSLTNLNLTVATASTNINIIPKAGGAAAAIATANWRLKSYLQRGW